MGVGPLAAGAIPLREKRERVLSIIETVLRPDFSTFSFRAYARN